MPREAGFSLAELHIHTTASDGIGSPLEVLEHVQANTKLDLIAITDHDTVRGASEACDIAARGHYRFEVVPGVEISTNSGHLLALFVRETVPYDERRPLCDYVRLIHEMGGVCIVAHPMSKQKNSLSRREIESLLKENDQLQHPDGIEILEPRVARIMNVEDVERLNRDSFRLAEVGTSDAHAPSIIGNRFTVFPGWGASALREAIVNRTTRALSGSPPEQFPR